MGFDQAELPNVEDAACLVLKQCLAEFCKSEYSTGTSLSERG